MPTLTTNYSLQKPLVNDATDQDLWGGELNEDMDDIDMLLRAGITIATQVSQTTGFTADASISVKKLYPCDATGGAFNATLPVAATAANGATVYFKKTDSSANAVTVLRAGSDTIDGSTSYVMSHQYDVVGLVSNGVSNWNVVTTASANVFTGDSGSGGSAGLVPAPPAGATAAGKILKADATWGVITPTTYQATPSNPAGSSSSGGVMMGLAGAFTPIGSGKIFIVISGGITHNTAQTDTYQIRYGTGAAPSNGAGLTGTAVGPAQQFSVSGSVLIVAPFSIQSLVPGLVASTPIWIDLSLACSSGLSTLSNIGISVFEL